MNAHKIISDLFIKRIDILTEDNIKIIKRNTGIISTNIQNILEGIKLPESIVDMLKQLNEATEDLVEDFIKEINNIESKNIENFIFELDEMFGGKDKGVINQMLEEEVIISDCLTQINDFGSQSFNEEEMKNCRNAIKKFHKILTEMQSFKNNSSEIKDLLQQIKNALKDLSQSLDDQIKASHINKRNYILNALAEEPKEGIQKENIVVIETILEILPLCNDIIENILKNGIDVLSSEYVKKVRKTHEVIEVGQSKLLNSKDISPAIKELLVKIKNILMKDKEFISQKLSERQIRREKQKVDNLIKDIEGAVPQEKLKELKENMEILANLQENIARERIEFIMNEELTELTKKKEDVKVIIGTMKDDPNIDLKVKEKLGAISEATIKANDVVQSKVEFDKISKLIIDMNDKIKVLKALEENKNDKKVYELKDFVNAIADILSSLMNKGRLIKKRLKRVT